MTTLVILPEPYKIQKMIQAEITEKNQIEMITLKIKSKHVHVKIKGGAEMVIFVLNSIRRKHVHPIARLVLASLLVLVMTGTLTKFVTSLKETVDVGMETIADSDILQTSLSLF